MAISFNEFKKQFSEVKKELSDYQKFIIEDVAVTIGKVTDIGETTLIQ